MAASTEKEQWREIIPIFNKKLSFQLKSWDWKRNT